MYLNSVQVNDLAPFVKERRSCPVDCLENETRKTPSQCENVFLFPNGIHPLKEPVEVLLDAQST